VLVASGAAAAAALQVPELRLMTSVCLGSGG